MSSARFHLAVRELHRPHMDLDAMVRVIERHAQDEEGIAVVGMLARLLNRRLRVSYSLTDLDRLLRALPARAAVKRYARALEILDRHEAHLDEFDELLILLSATTRDLEWLETAVSGLQEIGRPVTRLALIRLRSWAPDAATVGQYLRGVRALTGSGLDEREIDAFLHHRLQHEEATAIAGMIGHVGKVLLEGHLTLDKAERLFALFGDRATVARYEQAFVSLLGVGIEASEADRLAESLCVSKDDALWLDTCLRHTLEEHGQVTLAELTRLRELYPDVAHLYRYFRLREHFRPFTAIGWDQIERLGQTIIPLEGYERIVLGLLGALVDQGKELTVTIDDLRGYLRSLADIAQLPDPEWVPAPPGPACDCLSCLSRRAQDALITEPSA